MCMWQSQAFGGALRLDVSVPDELGTEPFAASLAASRAASWAWLSVIRIVPAAARAASPAQLRKYRRSMAWRFMDVSPVRERIRFRDEILLAPPPVALGWNLVYDCPARLSVTRVVASGASPPFRPSPCYGRFPCTWAMAAQVARMPPHDLFVPSACLGALRSGVRDGRLGRRPPPCVGDDEERTRLCARRLHHRGASCLDLR